MPRTDAAFAPPSSSRLSAASRITSSVSARRGPGRRRWTGIGIASAPSVDCPLDTVQTLYAVQKSWRPEMRSRMADTSAGTGLRRATGGLFLGGAVAFATAATVLSSTFDWPDILREPAPVVLPAFTAGGTGLV